MPCSMVLKKKTANSCLPYTFILLEILCYVSMRFNSISYIRDLNLFIQGMKKLITTITIIFFIQLSAQEHCGTMQYFEMQKSLYPQIENQLNQIELFTQ